MKEISVTVVRVSPDTLITSVQEVKDQPFAVVYNDDEEGMIYVFCEEPDTALRHEVDQDRFQMVFPGVEMYQVETRMLQPQKLTLQQQRDVLSSAMALVDDVYKHQREEEGTTAYDLYMNLSTMWNEVICKIYCNPDDQWPSRWWNQNYDDYVDFSQTQVV